MREKWSPWSQGTIGTRSAAVTAQMILVPANLVSQSSSAHTKYINSQNAVRLVFTGLDGSSSLNWRNVHIIDALEVTPKSLRMRSDFVSTITTSESCAVSETGSRRQSCFSPVPGSLSDHLVQVYTSKVS